MIVPVVPLVYTKYVANLHNLDASRCAQRPLFQETASQCQTCSLLEIAYLHFTSGTSSNQRAGTVPHRALAHNLVAIECDSGIGEHSRYVAWVPYYHDMARVSGFLSSACAPKCTSTTIQV